MRINKARRLPPSGQPTRRASGLLFSGLTVATVAFAVQYALPLLQTKSSDSAPVEKATNKANQNRFGSSSESRHSHKNFGTDEGDGPAGNSFGSNWFAKTFYDGGFEDKMNKREAALILGVRESAAANRVKDAHRRILLLNHPDRGGSAYIAAKINEAKDLLLKGKK